MLQTMYFNENFFAIAIQTAIWLPAIIMCLITGVSAAKSEGGRLRRISLYFSLFSGAIALTYIWWTLRALLFAADSRASDGWFILWQLAYGFGVLAFYFLALWSLALISPDLLEQRKSLYLVLLVLWLIVAIDLTVIMNDNIADSNPVVFAGLNDVKPDIILSGISTLAVVIYTGIPILGFLRYLLSKVNRTSPNFRKILIIEVGLIFFFLGSVVDASKAAPPIIGGALLFISRSFMGSGIILMFIGLKLPKRLQQRPPLLQPST